ncbi:MAG TPA: hypothetical protein VGL81_13995 [Polyangiaceae bacterium]|jgi:hypothetical protein
MIRRACALTVVSAVLAYSGVSAAGPSGVDLVVDECPHVHAEEVDRVLAIELAPVLSASSGSERLRAELSCDDARLSIVAIDPVTYKRLTRTVAIDRRTPDYDRTVALLVSQLFLTSWSELLLARSAAQGLSPQPPQSPAVEHAAEQSVRSALSTTDSRGELTVGVGARVRELSSPVVGGNATLRPSLLLGRSWRVFVEAAYERGAADRAQGVIAYSLGSGAVGAGVRALVGPVELEIDLRVGAAYVSVSGDATSGAVGTTASGAVGEAALDLGPTLVLGHARIGLLATAGATAPRIVASSTADRELSIGGMWLGASLVAGLAERAP